MTLNEAIDVLNEAVNDLADWGSVYDPSFDDKELQAQRLADYQTALEAIDIVSKALGRG